MGYCTVVVSPHPFNPAVVCCASDAIFASRLPRLDWRAPDQAERVQMSWRPAHANGTPVGLRWRRAHPARLQAADITVMKKAES